MIKTRYSVTNEFSAMENREFDTHAEAVLFLKEQKNPRYWYYHEITYEYGYPRKSFIMRGDDYLAGRDIEADHDPPIFPEP